MKRWTSFVANSTSAGQARVLHESGNPTHRLRVEHDPETLLVHLSDEDGAGWTVLAVDRATRAWSLAQGPTQTDTAVHAYEQLDRSGFRLDREHVRHWVAEYERAWREGDLDAIETMFTPDAEYRPSPYEPSMVGHEAIREFWLEDEGTTFTVTSEPVAIERTSAVVRLEVQYGEPVTQEYRDLWLLRFADDGRVEDFEEWAYWPGRGYSARED